MNIIDAVNEMDAILNPTNETIFKYLTEDYHVVTGDFNRNNNILIKYDLFVIDGVFYVAKTSDSTRNDIILTLEMAAHFKRECFDILWETYLSEKDIFLLDSVGHLHEANIRSGQFSLEDIKKNIGPKDIVYFNDVYSPIKEISQEKKSIYIFPEYQLNLVGTDAMKLIIGQLPNLCIVNSPSNADIFLLIMPNDIKAPRQIYFEILTKKAEKFPLIKSELKKHKKIISKYKKPILLFWSSKLFMDSLFHPNEAAVKAAFELSGVLQKNKTI